MTRFVIPMPGWSAPMVATSAHRGFFMRLLRVIKPAIHDLARLFDSLFVVRRE
jgi:hypothetical protein